MIQIDERFDVPYACPDLVWALLSRPEDVVECVPGAELGEQHEDGSFDGSLLVKFGPVKVSFRARIELELIADQRQGYVIARGKDTKGGSRFKATMGFRVMDSADAAATTVLITGQTEITGKLAGLVKAGARRVIERMSADFSANLAHRCGSLVQAPHADPGHAHAWAGGGSHQETGR